MKGMIDLNGMISLPFLKKAVFTGSHQGMNFMLKKVSENDEDKIQAIAWPGPFCFAATQDEKKMAYDTEYSPNGIQDAVRWLNEQYQEHFEYGSSKILDETVKRD